MKDQTDISLAFDAYVECALWTGVDDGDEFELNNSFEPEDIDPETLKEMLADVIDFAEAAEEWLPGIIGDWGPVQFGHDFWLTRNGHGAGFWDRGKGELGTWLTDMTKPYGSYDLYVGDDGKVYGS